MYKLLDLFCGGGGASFGYEQAGFEVTGVDITNQVNYVGDFVCDDALVFLQDCGHMYDAIHASPPCQCYSKMSAEQRKRGKEYPDLIAATRAMLIESNKPYIIENVPNSPLLEPILLCGTMFGLPTYRHRFFESNISLYQPEHPTHIAKCNRPGRRPKPDEYIEYVGHFCGAEIVRSFTRLTWLTVKQLSQSIPPQYTRYVGLQLLRHIEKELI